MAEETGLSLASSETPKTGVVAPTPNLSKKIMVPFRLDGIKSGRVHPPVRERQINMQRLSPNQTFAARATEAELYFGLFGILCSDELRVTSPCLHFDRHAKRIRYRVCSILTFMVGGKFVPWYDQIFSYFTPNHRFTEFPRPRQDQCIMITGRSKMTEKLLSPTTIAPCLRFSSNPKHFGFILS